uniref:Zinc finger GRF-type domain-containing protein n=1 Tax=Brassica campestris TaxID=3711 RepID=A0A3P6AH37_BRACM|nr:unnamed protein product [Brassica rapa]
MSSSSFTSGNYYRRRRNTERGTPKECWCGAPSDIFTSGSETNPGRLYYSCAKGYHKAEGKFDLVAELETLTAQHCEAEAELGAVKVIDPDWCKLHEKWMLDD